MSEKILKAIETAVGQQCGKVVYDRSARDWRITGVFASDIRAITAELTKIGLRRKPSASGFYVSK